MRSGRPWLSALVTLGVTLFLLVPLLLSVTIGFMSNYSRGIEGGWTLRWIGEVWSNYGDTLMRSLLVAFTALLIVTLLAVPAAYALARTQSNWAKRIEELMTLPVAVPGLASALGLLLTYGHLSGFRRSVAFIVVGHVLWTLPFMLGPVAALMRQRSLIQLEEAARTLGAGLVRRMTTVVIPACLPAIAAGAMAVITLSLGEFNMTWMLHTPLTRTLPVGMADSYASMRIEVGSAYTFIFVCVAVPLLLMMEWLCRSLTRRFSTAGLS